MIILLTICSLIIQCKSASEAKSDRKSSRINTSHLDALYKEISVNGDTFGFVHIYSEYPDYNMVDDADEGIACVDDASRAAIFYLRHYTSTQSEEHLHKARMLLKFLAYMQAANGYYYNFIWADGRVNLDGSTSKPEPNFWSWRVLWAYGEAMKILSDKDPLRVTIKKQRDRLINNIIRHPEFRSSKVDTTMGVAFATWLPKVSGTDQASIILIGLSDWLQQESESSTVSRDSVISLMNHFADGITLMQIEQPDSLHDGAFLSWENLWHAYANIQAYGLLTTGEVLDDPHMIAHALYEVDHFYPSVLKAGGLDHFFVRVDSGTLVRYDTKAFSQIAYGRRPMIWAAVKAYEITKDDKYLILAKDLTSWFLGKNIANTVMYDPATGRGFDGITNTTEINKNAGAESTIESLLSLQIMEPFETLNFQEERFN